MKKCRTPFIAALFWVCVLAFVMQFSGASLLSFAATGDAVREGNTTTTVHGKLAYYNINANTGVTLSGATTFGGSAITGVTNAARAITSGMTFFLESPSGGESFFVYVPDTTATSGNTIYVIPKNGDTVNSNIACTAGASKYILSGTVLSKKLIIFSTGTSTWYIDAVGTPTVEAD